MKNSKKTKIITSTSLATILSATAVGIASCSNIALARVKFSEVTSDVDEINIIPGVGFKQSVKLNAIFKDSNGNVVDDIEPKWVSNIDGINYYGDLPEGVLKIENNALVVDPCAITNQLFEGTCDVVIWAQTQNDKLEKDKMVSKTIKVTSTPTLDVPRYAQITNNNSMITVACGAEQQPYSCNLGITYWSGVINQEAFDDTNWTVLNRDGLPEDVILTVEQDKTNINNGILTVDPRKCSQSYDGFYNVVIQAQSKKCPTVLTKTTVQISLLGDSTPVSAKIIGDSELTIDPKTPHDYKFAYQCDIKNAGGSTIDNSPKSWYFDAAQLQALNNAGITLKFDNDNLVINTLACTLTEAKSFPLNVTCASEF